MPNYSVLLLFVIILLNLSCKKSITEPTDDTPQGGRRDYVWTEDTLKVGRGFDALAVRMWGDTPNNIWITAQSDFLHNIWHYDGNKVGIDSVIRFIDDPWGIIGFSPDDIWLGTGNSEIWHFDGKEWLKLGTYAIEGYKFVYISNFCGRNPQNIYGVGSAWKAGDITLGTIIHYNGKEWTYIDIEETNYCFSDIRYNSEDGKYYIQAYLWGPPETFKIFTFDGKSIQDIFTTSKTLTINNVGDKIYIVAGKQIYQIRNEKLELWKDYSNEKFFNRMWGTNENNIFYITGDGADQFAVSHYNGNNLEVLYKTDKICHEALVFEKEVFFLGFNPDSWTNAIIHGKLKEE